MTLSVRRDYLSFSAVSLYQSCSLRYFYKYVEGRREESVAASLVFGAAFHAALEHHYQTLLATDQPPDLDVLLDVFWAAWHERAAGTIVFGRSEDATGVAGLIDRTLRTFLESDLARPAVTIIGVEEELRAEIVPGCPDLLARLDLLVDIGDSLLVLDFKTARYRWNATRLADAAPQLHLYAELARPLA
jgi:putative RecB family exonuclease